MGEKKDEEKKDEEKKEDTEEKKPEDEEKKSDEGEEKKPEGEESEEKKSEEGEEKKEEEKEEEPKKEYKEVKKPHTFSCEVEEKSHNVRVLSKDQKKEAKKRIRALQKRDEDKLKDDEAKNTFESLIYEFRGWLNEGENEAFVPESERDNQIDKLR